MKRVSAIFTVTLLCLASAAQPDVFNLGPGLTNLEVVPVGDPGNIADTRQMNDGSSGYGSVGYTYNIGKYEVTAAQYADFLNHNAKISDEYGLYNIQMWNEERGCKIQRTGSPGNYSYSVAADWANRPVNYVNFWDACRFANWLHNGQLDGQTESGAYTLNGYNFAYGGKAMRNSEWKWAVTSENEWYKAAYYDPNKLGGAGYWMYPTQSNTIPSSVGSDDYDDPGNHANHYANNSYTIGYPYYRTNVGEFEDSASAYGTYDQGGNVWEWSDCGPETPAGFRLPTRGDSYDCNNGDYICASYREIDDPTLEDPSFGFRVSNVPEPSSIVALVGGLIGILGMRRRKA